MAKVKIDRADIERRLKAAFVAGGETEGTAERFLPLIIEAMAKRRLAEEYDAAQLRGEVRQHGGDQVSKSETCSFRDIGLTGKDIHEARQIRDAEETYPGTRS